MKNIRLYILAIIFSTTFFIWYVVLAEEKSNLVVAFLDVGQGDAIFIESPEGKQVLIDGGPNNGTLSQLSQIMPFYDKSIDMVILTHPDQDHIGGLPEILKDFQVDYVMEPGVGSDNGTYQELENIVADENITKILAHQGMKISLCNNFDDSCNIYLEVLFPSGDVDVTQLETNTASIVLKLVYGEDTFLFTGDSPQKIEKYLVSTLGNYLDVDVLKLGHHGSKTSSSEEFLGFTSPQYAIASVGENNRYGHPNKEVLDLLKKFGIDLLRTDEEGTIIFESVGQGDFKVKHLK